MDLNEYSAECMARDKLREVRARADRMFLVPRDDVGPRGVRQRIQDCVRRLVRVTTAQSAPRSLGVVVESPLDQESP